MHMKKEESKGKDGQLMTEAQGIRTIRLDPGTGRGVLDPSGGP